MTLIKEGNLFNWGIVIRAVPGVWKKKKKKKSVHVDVYDASGNRRVRGAWLTTQIICVVTAEVHHRPVNTTYVKLVSHSLPATRWCVRGTRGTLATDVMILWTDSHRPPGSRKWVMPTVCDVYAGDLSREYNQ